MIKFPTKSELKKLDKNEHRQISRLQARYQEYLEQNLSKNKAKKFLQHNRHKIEYDISVNDSKLSGQFYEVIYLIIFEYQYLQIKDNLLTKYTKFKDEIFNSSNPNEYVINLLLKYSKFEFKPPLFINKPSLLILIA
ncbi:3423_t:CDS:1 [Dentiscutata erythropus]|uniref:3423_t:CDS:1 n=1 Tax=Dentiscutata erythropus TaxID=1348616 RepID=A0A9N9DWQ4_9GLOM|nr:3423_t:CDS:1 [Dentiscutata erythropus]